jgi:multidrug resistance efflux pump
MGGINSASLGKPATIKCLDGSERNITTLSTVNAIAPTSPTGFALAPAATIQMTTISECRYR